MHVRSSRLRLLAATALVLLPAVTANAAEVVRAHGLSLLGQPEYAPGFKNFNWVNPNAPKGGSVHEWAPGSFDSLNEFPFKGIPPAGISLIHAYLLKQSPDEPATAYGVIAEWASHPADFSSVTFGLRASARFHDGRPITPEDVIFTIKELKAKSPNYAQYFKNIAGAEKTGEREVTVRFDVKNNREMPQIAGEIPVLPKHWWEAKGANGQPRDLANSSLEIPLGSGPYRIKAVDAGRAITYERVKDWWAADLPVMRGQNNFDEIQYTYYRDKTPAFEEF